MSEEGKDISFGSGLHYCRNESLTPEQIKQGTNRNSIDKCSICNTEKFAGICKQGHSGAKCASCKEYTVNSKCSNRCNSPEEVD